MKRKIFSVLLVLALVASFGLVTAVPVSATITDPTIEPVLVDTDDVAGKVDAAYQVTYTQDTIGTVSVITVTFPVGYTITNGTLGTEAVKNGDGSVFSVITIRGQNRAVDNVIGDSAGRTIAITLVNPFTYENGDAVGFLIVSGITNPTTADDYGPLGLTVDDNAAGNEPVQAAAAVMIIADAVDTLTMVVEPLTAVAGVAIAPPVEVKAEDEFGNVIEGQDIGASLIAGSGILSGIVTQVTDALGIATFDDLSINLIGADKQLRFTADLETVDSAVFEITPAAAVSFVFDAIGTQEAGVAFPITITALDGEGNVATDYVETAALSDLTGTIDLATTDAFSEGTWTGSVTITESRVGNTITAFDDPITGTSGPFDVTPAEKVALAFVLQPITTGAGEIIPVTVEIVDEFGNRTLDTDTITIAAIGPSELLGTLEVAADAGVATFSDLSIEEMGTGYTLEATSGELGSAESDPFDITVGTAAALAFVTQPTDAVAGVIITPFTVEIVDAYGNRVTTAEDEIVIAIDINPGDGALTGISGLIAVEGTATFSLSINKTGVGYTLVATAVGLDPATSDVFNITPAAKAALAFVQQPTDTIAGETISPGVTVEIVDEFGNRTLDTDTITIAAIGPSELLGTLEVAADAGLATFSDLSIEEAGEGYTLEAAAVGLTSDTSTAFDITPAGVTSVVVTADPTSIPVATGTSTITATVTDAFGNNVANGTEVSFGTTHGLVDPVTALTSAGEATTTLTAGYASGTATVTATADPESGSATVEFTAEEIAGITINVNPESIPADGAGTLTITVTLVDEHGNTTPTTGTTVYLETTAGTLDPVSGPTEAGVFTSTLTSSTTPGTVTVAVKVGGVFKGSVTVDFYSPALEEIGLQAGWNLISLMLIPDNSDIEAVLVGLPVDSVVAYDASIENSNERWSSYVPDEPSDLETMVDGKGYWVEMSAPATLIIVGNELPDPPDAPPTYDVVVGWNLIGFKSTTPMEASSYLMAIDGKYAMTYGFADGEYFVVQTTTANLDPGYGYWIAVTEAGTIYP